jgi:hypothetical protein
MFKRALANSVLWLAAAGAALGALLMWAGPGKATPVSALILLAWALGINSVLAMPSTTVRWLWVASRLFGVLAGMALGIRYTMDAFWPSTNAVVRSTNLSQALIAVFLTAAVWGGMRSGSVRVGALVAMAAAVIGSTISLAIYVPLFFATNLHNDPDPGEAVIVPAILIAVAAVVGTVGGMFGVFVAGTLGWFKWDRFNPIQP